MRVPNLLRIMRAPSHTKKMLRCRSVGDNGDGSVASGLSRHCRLGEMYKRPGESCPHPNVASPLRASGA